MSENILTSLLELSNMSSSGDFSLIPLRKVLWVGGGGGGGGGVIAIIESTLGPDLVT